ncbi:calnexin-like [Saccoglossus kowalevskii]|uniref:Calnexin-like n=1 Tax=Saccoglossus kowalevskii TaxID=10224 RepID=A0ABM0GQF0_SACKO|nr:PREDICTED: calnexin-like [Saccoglossus kowalevskii]
MVKSGLLALLALVLFSAFAGAQDDIDTEDTKTETTESIYVPPKPSGSPHFYDAFLSVDDFKKTWVVSQAKKDGVDEDIAKYDGKWALEEPEKQPLVGDLGLVLKSRAKHHAISAPLSKPFVFEDDPLIVQYEVKFQNGQECGGAYIKLLSGDKKLKLSEFHDKTPYTIMFGPDKCGQDAKLHFIFRHKNPITGEYEEKHAQKPSGDISNMFNDKQTHLYTLVVRPDNSYEVFVDQASVNSGNLLQDVRIPDPDAVKPEDWDEDEPKQIADPDAVKPDGWLDDEEELIDDPDAEKPEDWDDDIDGEWEPPQIENPACVPGCGVWEPPMINNPNYKGKWKAPFIENENYQGEWSARRIANPDYFEDLNPFKMTPFSAVGLELWSMSDGIIFDNFIITNDKAIADDWVEQTWVPKNYQEENKESAESVVGGLYNATEGRPWLWAVYALIVLIPVAMFLSFCIPKKKHPKKTDAPSPDDEPQEEEEEEEKASKKASKSDLEATQEEKEDGDDDDEEEEKENAGNNEASDNDDKEEGEEEEEEEEVKEEEADEVVEEPEEPSPRSTRKRRSRKD